MEDTDFTRAAGPLRREILVHCYRMLGSATDAEDAAQEAFLRAWRGFDRFEGRASVRTWLYQIATNVFRNWLEKRRNQAPVNAGMKPGIGRTARRMSRKAPACGQAGAKKPSHSGQ